MTINFSTGHRIFSRNYHVLLVIYLLMTFVYLIIVFTFKTTYHAMKLEVSQAALSQQITSAKEQVAFLNETQTQTAIYQHNLRHHLNAIEGFLSSDKPQQAKEYIKNVQADVESITPQRFCENELLNLLCSSFSNKAKRTGVKLTIKAKVPAELPVSDPELCSVISNALENALNAAALKKQDKWATLYCDIKSNKLLIEVKNPYDNEVIMREGTPVSNLEGHGYGCQSIRTIVEQHRGLCSFEPNDGTFLLRIVFPLI